MKLDYCSVEELASAAKSCGKTIGQIVLEEQAESMELTVQEVFGRMSSEFQVMKQSVTDGLNPDLRSASGLSGGAAAKMHTAVLQGRSHFGSLFGNAMAMALAVAESNSCMGQIVAAPTAGSCGVLPAALISVMEDKHIDETDIVMALFTASAIGMVIAKNASISGAEGGCQAEIGFRYGCRRPYRSIGRFSGHGMLQRSHCLKEHFGTGLRSGSRISRSSLHQAERHGRCQRFYCL